VIFHQEKNMCGILTMNQHSRRREKQLSEKNVPLDAFYKCWHMAGRVDHDYYITDLITDILGGSTSSRLFQTLVKEKKIIQQY
jgi:predicted Zn-dependent peptidase